MSKEDVSIWKRWDVMAIVFIVVAVMIAAGGYTAYGVFSSVQNSAGANPTVHTGDQISVNYIGMFEDGTIFDTSIQSVAENDTLYPKSLSFSATAPFNPLNFTVGNGQVVPGFDSGVIGMGLNQTKVLTIPPDKAYGKVNEALIQVRPLTETFPITEWVTNSSSFIDAYSVSPAVGRTVKNTHFGWNMTVYYIDPSSGDILLKHEPYLGEVIQINMGWDSIVKSIDTSANNGTGEITVQHLLRPEDAGSIRGLDSQGPFFVTGIDIAAGTMTVDYNREVVGKTLIFKVTVVSINPGK